MSFGGSKDIVDTALLATPQGLDALTWVLVTLGVPLPEIEKAIRLLHESLHHDIPNVHLTRAALLRVGRLELAHRSRP